MRVSYLTINIKIIKFKRSNSKSMVLHSKKKKTILMLLTQEIQLEKVCYCVFFKNTRILKFKSQLTITFFAAVNHLNGPLRKQNFSLTGSKGHGLWFVIGGLRSLSRVSVFQDSLLVIVIMKRKTQFWRRFFNFRVRMFVKSEVSITDEKLIKCWNIRLN